MAQTNQDKLVTRFGYDGAGRLIAVTNALNQVTRYQYDEAANETAQVDALNRTNTFAYDSMGRRIQHFMPGGQAEGFGYDLAGNLICQTNFNGAVITNQYDVMNRLANQASVNGYSVSCTYTATGQRQTMTDASGATSYSYDNRDRLLLKTVSWNNGPTVSLNYAYDANGEVTNLWSSTTNGVNLVYNYDPLGRLTNVLANGSMAAGYGFDAVGNLQAMSYGNGMTNLYQYDSLNRLTNSVWKLNAGTLASFYYQAGLTGNRTNLSETVNGTGRTYAWNYDSLYRMTNETISGIGNIGYGYDPVGNRTNRQSSIAQLPTASYIYNPNDWLTNTDQYDSNGSTTNSTGNAYQYDVMNHVTNVNNTIFITYDGDGNRASKTISGTTTCYLLDDRNPSGYVQVLEEYQSSSLSRVYNYGLSLISQRQVSSGTVSYYGYDGHGSVRFLTSTNGAVTDTYTYDAYGTLIAQTGNNTPNNCLYAGQQFDSDLGFYYLRARYLNPNTGRFWTMDSYEGNNEDPLSLHKYLYCEANPVNGFDPSGHQDLITLDISLGIGEELDSEDDVAVAGVEKATTAKIFQFYLGFKIVPEYHAVVYVCNTILGSGSVYDVVPNKGVPELWGSYPGSIRQRSLNLSGFKTYAPIYFKICKLSEITYISWRTTMQVISALDDVQSTWVPTQFSYYGFDKFFRPPYNCTTWALKATVVARGISVGSAMFGD